jgi:hypothetical protein
MMIALVGPGHRLREGVPNLENRRVSIRYFSASLRLVTKTVNKIVSENKGLSFIEKPFLHSCWKGENAPTCPVIKEKH